MVSRGQADGETAQDFGRYPPKNSVGKFIDREAVCLSLDDYLTDVKPFFDTVVRVNYSSGFPVKGTGCLCNDGKRFVKGRLPQLYLF